jgi:isovaleryl-CoA dehydrogenase
MNIQGHAALVTRGGAGRGGAPPGGAGWRGGGSRPPPPRREGDLYILNGTKIYITNGPVADVLLVYAKTAPELGAKGISAFIVEKNFPGFKVAQKLIKMGFRGSQTGELVFDNCRVPAANLVGKENEGVKIVMSGLDLERALVAGLCVGICERALELSVEYARTRVQFGKPIGSFQMVQAMLAEMYTEIEAMKTLVWRTLAEVNDLEVGGGGRGDAHKLTAASILYAGEACNRVLNKAVQVHGGSGYIWESEINRLFRCIKILEIGAGTSEVRKMIIAEELLRG